MPCSIFDRHSRDGETFTLLGASLAMLDEVDSRKHLDIDTDGSDIVTLSVPVKWMPKDV